MVSSPVVRLVDQTKEVIDFAAGFVQHAIKMVGQATGESPIHMNPPST